MSPSRSRAIPCKQLTAKVISGLVVLARYISAPIALKYGTSEPRISSSFLKVEMDPYSHQVNEQPSEYLMDALHPYIIFSTLFLCGHIDEQKYHLSNAKFANQDRLLSFLDLSSQIHSLNNQLSFEALLEFQ